MTDEMVALGTMANGAVAEAFDVELQAALRNVLDVNCDWRKARKVVVEVELRAQDEMRSVVAVGVHARSRLIPAAGVATVLYVGREKGGRIKATEYNPRQANLFDGVTSVTVTGGQPGADAPRGE
jgi:hypothetical protein